MKRKIRSQKGASISFALLLFLVCAVVSSIVIVSASAVGGRFSKLGQMDQRYYAVTSAARLLCKEFGGAGIISEAKVSTTDPDTYELTSYMADAPNTKLTADSLIRDASEAWIKAYLDGTALDPSKTDPIIKYEYITFETTEVDIDNSELDVTAEERLYPNGLLEFRILSVNDPDDPKTDGVYKLTVTFASNTKSVASDSEDDTQTIKVNWLLHSVKKERAGS